MDCLEIWMTDSGKASRVVCLSSPAGLQILMVVLV